MRYIYISLLVLLGFSLSAQDLHFTQFYSTPLTLNPALTGNFIEDYRVGGNFKQQWPWAKNARKHNYITYSAFGDVALLRGKLHQKDWIGVGAVVLHDRAGDGNLAITKVFVNGAYHKTLDKDGKYYLSLGVSLGFVQKGIDYDNLYFNNQWNERIFDTSLGSGENSDGRANYFDMGTGLSFGFTPRKNMFFIAGIGLNHITRPKESFYSGQTNRLGIRPVASITGIVQLNEKWHIEPGIMYMNQKNAQEILLHLMAGYTFKTGGPLDKSVFYFGMDYRAVDALAPVMGFKIKSIKILANYDVNLSSLTASSRAVGGIELSIVHTGYFPGTTSNRALACPRL